MGSGCEGEQCQSSSIGQWRYSPAGSWVHTALQGGAGQWEENKCGWAKPEGTSGRQGAFGWERLEVLESVASRLRVADRTSKGTK